MQKTIVIVGAALSGPTAAARARELDESARIILIERNTRVSYALAGLSLHLSGEVANLDDLNREREDFFRSVYNIEVLTRTEVISIDAAGKKVEIQTPSGRETVNYTSLIYAAGAASLEPSGAAGASNHCVFRTLDDLEKISGVLKSGKKRFVILGGGPMGIEAADGLVRAGAEVTIVERSRRVLPLFSTLFSSLAEETLARKMRILTGAESDSFEIQNGQIVSVSAKFAEDRSEKVETDFVISCTGVRPRTEILGNAGANLAADGSVIIDEYCRTSLPDVFACGVGVHLPERDGARFLPQAAAADRTAQAAGANAAGASVRLENLAGAMLLRLPADHGEEIGRTGLSLREAKDMGKDASRVIVHVMDREAYMPGAAPVILQLIFEKGSGRILGLEGIGPGLARRLDTASAAIAGGLSIHKLAGLDSAYHPSSGAVRDALMVAATVASQAERGQTRFVEVADISKKPGEYLILDAGKKADGSVHLHIPLEDLRGRLTEVKQALEKSQARRVAVLSETGRRGHLAERILAHNGIEAVNIQGGRRLFGRSV
ncbi:MAG: FAD-dependent oxidoreductase [Leptospirales bacterium]|nr:FAD-dependent oxidoreductase [Leptospirales bacterium]